MKFLDRIDELNNTVNKDNILSPPLTDRESVDFLRDYLLDEDFQISYSCVREQANTEIVFAILRKYSKKFRKELKERKKKSKQRRGK